MYKTNPKTNQTLIIFKEKNKSTIQIKFNAIALVFTQAQKKKNEEKKIIKNCTHIEIIVCYNIFEMSIKKLLFTTLVFFR